MSASFSPRSNAIRYVVLAAALSATPGVASADGPPATRPSAAPAAPVLIIGSIKILVSVTAGANVPSGTTLSASPQLSVSDTTFANSASTYSGSATVSGGKATYSITIPYRWNVASRSDLINVSISLGGSYTKGSTSTYFSKNIAIPANGTTTTVSLSGSI